MDEKEVEEEKRWKIMKEYEENGSEMGGRRAVVEGNERIM